MVGEQADHAKKIGGAEVVVLDAPSVTALKADVEARPRIGRRDRRRRRPFVVGRSEAKAVEAPVQRATDANSRLRALDINVPR